MSADQLEAAARAKFEINRTLWLSEKNQRDLVVSLRNLTGMSEKACGDLLAGAYAAGFIGGMKVAASMAKEV